MKPPTSLGQAIFNAILVQNFGTSWTHRLVDHHNSDGFHWGAPSFCPTNLDDKLGVYENGIDHPIPTIYIYWGTFEYRKENHVDQLVESGVSPSFFRQPAIIITRFRWQKSRLHTHTLVCPIQIQTLDDQVWYLKDQVHILDEFWTKYQDELESSILRFTTIAWLIVVKPGWFYSLANNRNIISFNS